MDSPVSSPAPESLQDSGPRRVSQQTTQPRPTPIIIPSLSGRAITARRLLDSPGLFAPGTPITPSPPPSSRATSASFFENSDESTLSLPDANQGPHPRIIRGWTAFTNLNFQREEQRQESTEEVDEDSEDFEPPAMNNRKTTQLCGLCFTTRLIGGREFCAKCTKLYNVAKGKGRKSKFEEEPEPSPIERTPEELYMLKLWHGQMPEPCDCGNKDDIDLDNEVLQVESDMEESEDDLYTDEDGGGGEQQEDSLNNNDHESYGFLNDEDDLMLDADADFSNSISTEDPSLRVESDDSDMEVDEKTRPRAMLASKKRWMGKRVRGLLPEFRPYRKV